MLIFSPREHGLDALLQAGLFGKLDEQLERFVGDAVLGVVEEEAFGFCIEAGSPVGILIEELAQSCLRDLGGMLLECLPRREFEKRHGLRRGGGRGHGVEAPCVGNPGRREKNASDDLNDSAGPGGAC